MSFKFGRPCVAALAPAFAALFLSACSDNPEETAPPGPYKPSEPKYALANVELAFNGKNAALLDRCLDPGYRFYFDVNDVGERTNGYLIPEYWSRADFLGAAGNMFGRAYAVSMNNGWKAVGSPGPGENNYTAASVGLRFVVMVDANNGYMIDDGTCDYDFAEVAAGEWRLTRWKDRSRECGCVGETTLGRILASYYR